MDYPHIYIDAHKGPLKGYELRIDILGYDYSEPEPVHGYVGGYTFDNYNIRCVIDLGHTELVPYWYNDKDNGAFIDDVIDFYGYKLAEAVEKHK